MIWSVSPFRYELLEFFVGYDGLFKCLKPGYSRSYLAFVPLRAREKVMGFYVLAAHGVSLVQC